MSTPISRRTLVALTGAAGGALALGGCDGDPVDLPGRPAPEDPDTALVRRAVRAELAMLARVEAAALLLPEVSAPLGDAALAHRAHLRVLRHEPPRPPVTPPRSPDAPVATVRALGGAERALQRRLGRLALEARSGALARVLAAMAAASAQQAVVIDGLASTLRPRRGRRGRR